MKISSTIGYERAENATLAITDEREFVADSLAKLGPQPPNFQAIVAINRGPLRADGADPQPLTPRQVERLLAGGALLVDVRTDQQFDEAHVPGAVCITALRAGFGTKLAWLADPGGDVVLVGRDDDDARAAVALAQAVGITRIGGFLAGGMTSWREERRPVERITRMAIEQLHDLWSPDGSIQVIDVRERPEWAAGHIPGSHFCPYHDLGTLPDTIDRSRPVAVICGSGQRAATGASLVQRAGIADVIHVVDGGVPRWGRQGWPLETGGAGVAVAAGG